MTTPLRQSDAQASSPTSPEAHAAFARRHEIAALRYSPTDPDDRDLDVRRSLVHVLSKGGKDNYIAPSNKTMTAVEDDLRARRKHAHADELWLWLGKKGRLTDSGIAQTLRDRGARVSLIGLHAHDFRHAATHHELAGGMNEADVMSKRGWDSPAMLRRYASTTQNVRAIEASRKFGLGDRLQPARTIAGRGTARLRLSAWKGSRARLQSGQRCPSERTVPLRKW